MRLTILLASFVAYSLAACESPPNMHATQTVGAGDDVIVTFDAALSNRASSQYWIALQRADTPTSDTTGRVVLERGDGRVVLHAVTPGDYEIRLHDGYPSKEHHLVSRVPLRVLHGAE